MSERRFNPNALRRLRTERGLSQFGLATEIETHPAVICAWENGRRRPGPVLLPRLVEALGVPVDDLFADDAKEGAA